MALNLELEVLGYIVCEGGARNCTNSQYFYPGMNARIKSGFRIECYKEFAQKKLNPKLVIGDNVIIGYNFSALVSDRVSIGDNTILASNIFMTTHNHGVDVENDVPFYRQPLITAPVSIGSECWIGEKVVILPGVTIEGINV